MQKDLHNSMFVRGGVERRHAIRVAGAVSAIRQFQYFTSVDLDHEHFLADFFDLDVAMDYATAQCGHRVRRLFGQNLFESAASASNTLCHNLQANAADLHVSGVAQCYRISDDVALLEIFVHGLSVVGFARIRVCDRRMDCK